MSDFILHTADDTILRAFAPDVLAPAADILAAGAAARKGEHRIDPLAALVRSALATERPRSTVRRLQSAHRLRLPAIPPEVHAQYQTAFATRMSHYKAQGKAEAEARALAFDDLGHEQFFAHAQEQAAPPLSASAPVALPHPFSEVERARIKTENGAKVRRLRSQWAAERAGKGAVA